jgi:hypothetical protein
VTFDRLLVATLEPSERLIQQLVDLGVDREQLLMLRPHD